MTDAAISHASKAVTVLGATGSIGASTLDVIARHPDRYRVFALTANSSVDKLAELAKQFQPHYVVVKDDAGAAQLRQALSGRGIEVLCGNAALQAVAAHAEVDIVVAAIVGAAGLEPTLAAVQAGKHVLLANKEALVMAGRLFMDAVAASGATLLPVDSEHNAIFQCMPPTYVCGAPGRETLVRAGVRKILLTGSGGPFRNTPLSDLVSVTPAQAIAHPNWSMGPKISVDSATMMNKGLGADRGVLAVRCAARAGPDRRASAVGHSQHGGIHRRLGARATRQPRYAHADRACAGMAGAY